ncbi:hypothetical protein RWE15_22255 [Virgibacillus halophilus]|uniref:Uncharacterized protein n=1 Tax=Tigheibacillus halophilus TaxID=361280 RepID=A0ABU5CB44_9BACI|nr:hypothetical protein [Virgibacillus halophilus]
MNIYKLTLLALLAALGVAGRSFFRVYSERSASYLFNHHLWFPTGTYVSCDAFRSHYTGVQFIAWVRYLDHLANHILVPYWTGKRFAG